MSIYSGNITGIAPQMLLGTILVILPKAPEVYSNFVVLVLPFGGPQQFKASRFDVMIETRTSKKDLDNGAFTIFGRHSEYCFTLEVSDVSLSISVGLSFGVLAPATLQLLTMYPDVDTPGHLLFYVPRITSSANQLGQSLVVILPHDVTNASSFLALLLSRSDAAFPAIHQGSISDDDTAGLRLEIAFNGGGTTFSGAISTSSRTLRLKRKSDDFGNDILEMVLLAKSQQPPTLFKASGPVATITNDKAEVIRCTLQESGLPAWQSIAESSFGFGVAGISLVTASATIAAALPATVPVILGTIGLILAARSLTAAVDPPPDGESSALYHGDRLRRQSSNDNDVIIMRAHLHQSLQLAVKVYQLAELGGQALSVSDIMRNGQTQVTTLFTFRLSVPQTLSVRRAIAIPSLVPAVPSQTQPDDVSDMNGALVLYSTDFSKSDFYAASDLFEAPPETVFKYASGRSSYIIQQGSSHDLGYGNKVSRLPTHGHPVLKLRRMSILSEDKGTRLSGRDPLPAIDGDPGHWAYTHRSLMHAGQIVTAYDNPGSSTRLVPSRDTDTYFVVKDWIPYQVFLPSS